MKKLVMIAITLFGMNALAAETLRTRTYCVDVSGNMTSQVVQGESGVFINVGESTIWPQLQSGKKVLYVTQKGIKDPTAALDLGNGKSSATYLEVPQKDGSSVRCHVLMDMVPAKKTFSILVM
ncbi:hypothetical protein [Bdellovibrio sp. HCB-162]|uniref:hypothetical protein n=1 Tax=Bdellovibrio sp. HCB-162 TaxID=3394234 RepID=UPI0039BC5BF5